MRFISKKSRKFLEVFFAEKKWRDVFDVYLHLKFSQKMACAQFVCALLFVADESALREMVEAGLLRYMNDFLDLDVDNVGKFVIMSMKRVVDVFEEVGAPGFLVEYVKNEVSSELIGKLVGCGNQVVARQAAILESTLVRLVRSC
jgi:hypothetical protein